MLIPSNKIYCLFYLKTSLFTVKWNVIFLLLKHLFLEGEGSASNTRTMTVNYLIFQHHFKSNLINSRMYTPTSLCVCLMLPLCESQWCPMSSRLGSPCCRGRIEPLWGKTKTLRPMLWPLVALRGNHADKKGDCIKMAENTKETGRSRVFGLRWVPSMCLQRAGEWWRKGVLTRNRIIYLTDWALQRAPKPAHASTLNFLRAKVAWQLIQYKSTRKRVAALWGSSCW